MSEQTHRSESLVIGLPELAQLVGANLPSMRNAFYTHPEQFPPAIYIPGCKGVRFLRQDVFHWLDERKSLAKLDDDGNGELGGKVGAAPTKESSTPLKRPRGGQRIAHAARYAPCN
jgi:predicted DNA-binding transcriptional regulator AlpA